jgi:hypothetical protein
VLLILSGLGFGALAFFEYNNVSGGIGDIGSEFAAASMDAGIWTLLAGAVATVVAGFTLNGQMSPAPAASALGGSRSALIGPFAHARTARKSCKGTHPSARTADVSRLPGSSKWHVVDSQ